MQYQIQHTCGHDATIRLYGHHTERNRVMAWLAAHPCWRCADPHAYSFGRRCDGGGNVLACSEMVIDVARSYRIRDQLRKPGHHYDPTPMTPAGPSGPSSAAGPSPSGARYGRSRPLPTQTSSPGLWVMSFGRW